MSLSTPMTRAPSRAKRFTLSEPISPAEPVTMIVRIITILAAAVSPPNNPCHFAAGRVHSRCGKLSVAVEHALD
jgi:hypothetical protein